MNRHSTSTHVFAWFRRMAALRFVLVVAAVMSSQSSLVCACDGSAATGAPAVVADVTSSDDHRSSPRGAADEICCSSCVDCAQCGGCHASAASLRADASLPDVSITDSLIAWTSAARAPWTQPTPSRPPIATA